MATKLPPIFLFRRITLCVSRNHKFYSSYSSDSAPIRTETNLIPPKSKEVESAILFLKKKLHPDDLVRVLDSVSDVPSATAIFRWASRQRNFQHTAQTYAHMIWRLGTSGNSEQMEVLLKEMVKFGFLTVNSSFKFLVESFCTNQRTSEALKVFEIARLANLRLPVSTCNLLLRVLVSKTNNFGSVIFVYKEMVKAEILPDVDTLNCVIKGLCETGRLDSALIQFWGMEQKHCSPNSWTFELIIASLCSGGRIGEAVEIWKQMLLLECRPDCGFYARIIPLFCGANRTDESIKLFKMMKDDGNFPDLYLYSALIECLSENLQLKDAVEILEEMADLGISPCASSYVHIVHGYCKLGNVHEAMEFLNKTNNCPVEPYDALLSSLCDLDRFREAISLLKEMLEKCVGDGISWNIIIFGLCKKGNVRKALEVACRMVVLSNEPDNITCSSLITGYCRNTEFEKALYMFKQESVRDMFLDTRSCSELIEGLCHVKKIQEAAEVFYHIVSRGHSPSINSLSILISDNCVIGKVDEAIKILLLASANCCCFSSSIYTPIITGLLELNKDRYILHILAQMFVNGCTLDLRTYCILIHGLCMRGRSRVAADLFNQMVDDGLIPGSENLEKLIEGFAEGFSLKLVAHHLEKLIEAGVILRPLICNAIISSLLNEGQKFVACKFLDWMLGRGWVPDPDTHVLLVGNFDSEKKAGAMKLYDTDTDMVRYILAEGFTSYA
ncbi:pentatricopeptide repeat-containing protein At5g64320, mitochondrial-like [Phalaenopsis equestris]|uniref:pentatricopeptide repeat-containing protein At5g64320, mitochondrial-like n=1 Tax=Phalaenopsis equestris TaxID=78828 RepID=UPI0009E58B00|nr:pentatricopeptide repeat-containing protein At5g64320, mitochondrial-like [Phalaenopsis equestris]XP_020573481.1 pentatricopeptide repeat-containing protein At5g64320, mitochondrial-like [Phalaenopsis equestris]